MNKESYGRYLKSPEWRRVRSAKLARKGGSKKRCAICGRLEVHHLVYRKRLSDVEPSDLRVFCRNCHELAHKLQRMGLLVYRTESHRSRFALTKHAIQRWFGRVNKLFHGTNPWG